MHGNQFEYFITYAGTDRYNIMCYLFARDKRQPVYEDEERSLGDSLVPKHVKNKQ